MYTDRQHEKVPSRVIGQPEEKGVQQFRMKDNRGSNISLVPKNKNIPATVQRFVFEYGESISYEKALTNITQKGIDLNRKDLLFLKQLINSEKHYHFEYLLGLLLNKRVWKQAGSTKPDKGEITSKITNAGFPRRPEKIKKDEQPVGHEELTGVDVRYASVRKNLHYCNITKGDAISIKEGQTYLWVEKPDESIIIGDEAEGLGHPTLALDLKNPQSSTGTTGMARIGGELKKVGDKIFIDNASGRFGKERVRSNLRGPKEKIEQYFNMPVVMTFIDKKKR